MTQPTQPLPAPPVPEPQTGLGKVPRIASARLLGAAQELHIEHRGEIYRLRKTSQGKLILTK